jgi:hypothetical protein
MGKNKQFVDLEDERYGLFMNQNSFNLDVMYGRNYLHTDNTQYITLYRINVIESKTHSLYGQSKAKDKKFMSPVKLNIMLDVEESTQQYYGNNQGGITRDDTGNLVFGIYLTELEEKNTEINRGDIIAYNLSGEKERYYEVENANTIDDTTDKTIGGFNKYWKRIVSVPIKEDVIPFINETI